MKISEVKKFVIPDTSKGFTEDEFLTYCEVAEKYIDETLNKLNQ